jgi:hypothetical protein
VVCAIYKCDQNVNLLSELFAIDKFTIYMVFREVVHVINGLYKFVVHWHVSVKMQIQRVV